jgi:hypothetical protein
MKKKELNEEQQKLKEFDELLNHYKKRGDLILIIRSLPEDSFIDDQIKSFVKGMRDEIDRIMNPEKHADTETKNE